MAGRFSFSVPGRRSQSDPWFRIGNLDVTTTVLVIMMAVASMVVWALEGPEHPILEKLVLLPDEVLNGQVWRVATWPLVNNPDIWFVIMLAVFWYFGSELERLLGRNRFALFLLLITVIPGVLGAVLDLPQAGMRAIELSVFLVFVAEYPFARFFFNIPAWVVAAVIVGIEFIQLLGDRDERGILFRLISIAVAAVTARTMGLASSLPWIPALPIGSHRDGSSQRSATKSRGKSRRRSSGGGEVVRGPWSPPSRSGPVGVAPLPQPPGASSEAVADQAELDALLDKISAVGMDGLSADEKRRLNELSKRMRNRP
jgi:membrane associated rhomboid family serine protease